ncbi:hypothetical protein K7432_015141, partial [Basidiobolus ranarum]
MDPNKASGQNSQSTLHRAIVPPPPTKEEVAAAIAETEARNPSKSSVPKDYLSKFRCDGKVAVITGGARGLGFSMAEGLCSVGLKAIAILDIQEDLGQEAISTLKSLYKVETQFYKVDVRDEVSVQQVIDSVVRDLGSIDIVVNSAGVADLVHAEEYPPDKFRRVVDINLNGSFLVSQACGRQMIKQKRGGSIIFIASMSGSI